MAVLTKDDISPPSSSPSAFNPIFYYVRNNLLVMEQSDHHLVVI